MLVRATRGPGRGREGNDRPSETPDCGGFDPGSVAHVFLEAGGSVANKLLDLRRATCGIAPRPRGKSHRHRPQTLGCALVGVGDDPRFDAVG